MSTIAFTPAIASEGFGSYLPAIDETLREFLTTAARYLLTPRDLIALGRLDERALSDLGLSSADFDDLLAATWRNHE